MPNPSFAKTFVAVISTFGLVASAMTGLLFSTLPSQAFSTNVTPSGVQSLVTGDKLTTTFKYTLSNSEIGGASGNMRLALRTTDTSGALFNAGLNSFTSSSDCRVVVTYTNYTKTFNDCSQLIMNTGGYMSPTDTDQEFTVVADQEYSVMVETKVTGIPTNLSNNVDLNLYANVYRADTAQNFESQPAQFNLRLGNLEIKKTRVTAVDAAYTGATLPAAPNSDSYFEIVVTNKNNFAIFDMVLKDWLNSTADSYYGNCAYGTASSNPAGTFAAFAGFTATPAHPLEATGVGSTVPAKTTAGDGKFVVYVGCDRTSTLPSNPGTLTNYAKIKDGRLGSSTGPRISDSAVSSFDLSDTSADLRAQANFAGGADLSIKKEVVSNGLGSSTSGDVTYRITVKNESTANASDKVLIQDFFQAPGGATDSAVLKGTAIVNRDSDIDGSAIGSVMPDVKTAYADARNVQNTGIYFSLDKMSPSESVQYTYTVKYGISSSDCSIDQPARLIRNSALVSPMPATYTVGGSVLLNSTNIEDVVANAADVYGGTATLIANYDISGNTVTIIDSHSYSDPSTTNNFSFQDITPDICKPDMMLVSKSKSVSPTSTAGIGEEVEYTVTYKNYAARVQGTNQVRSGAKGIRLEDKLPVGVSFVKIVSPTTAAGSLGSDNMLTITNLPELKLGDESEQVVKYVVKMPVGVASAGKEIKNVVSVKANNEQSGFECFKEDLGTVLNTACDASGTSQTYAGLNSRGNNTFKNTITLIGGPDVQVTKTVDIGEGQLKMDTSMLTYTVKVKNIGTETANSVMLRDTLPTCTTFDSKVSGIDGTLTSDQRNVDYNIGNLNVDQEVTIVFKARVSQNDACKINNSTVIQNSATATISSSQKDLNTTNNTGIANSSIVALNQNAGLTKTVDQVTAQPGATLNYTITLRSQGAKFEGMLMDELPSNVTFVSSEPAAVRDGSKLNWANVTVDAGKELKAMVKVTVNSDANGTVLNKVTATTKDGKVNFAQAVTSIEVAGNAKVSGYVYFDANRNKKLDTKERDDKTYGDYLGGIRVLAVASNGKEFVATTDRMGMFMFDKLPAGKYTVKVDITTVKGTYKNIQLNVAATDPSMDGLTKTVDVRANESFDLTAAFRLFTGQTSTGATVSNGFTSISGLVAVLSFSFLATFAYAAARKRALSL